MPATVTAPPLVRPTAPLTLTSSSATASTSVNCVLNHPYHDKASTPLSGCPVGIALLQKFHMCIEGLPCSVGEAGDNHPLAAFAGDPVGCVGDNEDTWEKFDRPLNALLQKPSNELRNLVRVGENGLIGLCRLLEYLVTYHQLSGYLFEGKLEQLMLAIDDMCVNQLKR